MLYRVLVFTILTVLFSKCMAGQEQIVLPREGGK